MKTAKRDMRSEMPITAALVDDLRAAFGAEVINDAIRRGMRGEQGFHATENGNEVGTPLWRGVRIGTDARGNRYSIDGPQPGDVVEGKPARKAGSDDVGTFFWEE